MSCIIKHKNYMFAKCDMQQYYKTNLLLMYIEWNKKYLTDIEKIDEQHKILVDIINKLHHDIIINKDGSIINDLLMDLKIYTINHFSTEEKLLKKYNYPAKDEHIEEHQKFMNKISEILFDVSSANLTKGYCLIEFLKEWITEHVLILDMEYVAHFKKHHAFLAEIQSDIK